MFYAANPVSTWSIPSHAGTHKKLEVEDQLSGIARKHKQLFDDHEQPKPVLTSPVVDRVTECCLSLSVAAYLSPFSCS